MNYYNRKADKMTVIINIGARTIPMANIGIIINSLRTCGGEERVVSLMANEWVKDHNVTIYSFETRNPKPEEQNDYPISPKIRIERVYMPNDGFCARYLKVLYFYTGFINTSLCRKFLKKLYYPKSFIKEWIDRINASDLDIVIAISGNNTMLLGQIKDHISCKTIGWEHSSFEGYFDRKTGAFKNRIETYVENATKLDKIVLLNQDIERKFKAIGLNNTTIIPNPKSFSMSQKASMSNHSIVTCGRIEAEKGYFDLVKAFANFHKDYPEWSLTIVGGGSLKPKLDNLIDSLRLSKSITVTGYVKDVQKYLLNASIYVMTSRWEGFPMSVTEALEAGLPVVAFDIPAMEPLVSDNIEGLIVPSFDNVKFADALKKLASNEEKRVRMSCSAIQKALSLDPQNVALIWDSVFKELTGH